MDGLKGRKWYCETSKDNDLGLLKWSVLIDVDLRMMKMILTKSQI